MDSVMDVVLAQARVPTELRDKPPLEWTNEDVTSWLCSLGLHTHVEKFEEEGVDGMSLFDISEEELVSESLITQIGSRKKFIRARGYLLSAFKVMEPLTAASLQASASMDDGQRGLGLLEGTFIRNFYDPDDADELKANKGKDAYAVDNKGKNGFLKKKAEFSSANIPPWQKKEDERTSKVTGGACIVLEIGLNMFDRVHPAAHLIILLPGGISALTGYLAKARFCPNSAAKGGACKGVSEKEHKMLVKAAKREGDESIAYEPARYAVLPEGQSKYEYATNLQKRAVHTMDVFGLCFFLVALVFFGILFALGRLQDMFLEPEGIVGFIVAMFGIFAFSAERVIRRFKKPEPVLYGEGGTHNHLLGEGHKGTLVNDMETGGAGERVPEDMGMENEFTPLTPTSAARRKNPRSFGEH